MEEFILKRLFKLFKGREEEEKKLEAIQVEVCATCNCNCSFCPTGHLKYPGPETMDLEVFKKIVPYFSWSKWVYLQGWGEPLLHQDFWQMVQLTKKTGVKVGFTTNGTLLDNNAINSVFSYGVDLIATSIAGATEDNHSKLRLGSSLALIGENLERLLKERRARGTALPKVSVSYMLTKDNIHELQDALKLAMSWGVDEFYTTHLDYIFNDQADEQKIFGFKKGKGKDSNEQDEEYSTYQKHIDAAINLASKERFPFRFCGLIMKEQEACCEQNPNKFVFITASGDVTSCTYLGRAENPKVFSGQCFSFPRQIFGNIQQLEFDQILAGKDYKEFCEPLAKREEALAKLLYVYGDCEPSLVRIQSAEEEYNKVMEKYPLPKPCQVCPKVYGI